MAKPPAKKPAAKSSGGTRAIAAAKAKLAKLEATAKKKRAVAEATAGVKAAAAALAKAKKLPG